MAKKTWLHEIILDKYQESLPLFRTFETAFMWTNVCLHSWFFESDSFSGLSHGFSKVSWQNLSIWSCTLYVFHQFLIKGTLNYSKMLCFMQWDISMTLLLKVMSFVQNISYKEEFRTWWMKTKRFWSLKRKYFGFMN